MLSSLRWIVLTAVLVTSATVVWLLSRQTTVTRSELASLALHDVLGDGAGASGFARADKPITFNFPADHGTHPAFRSEWWYFTGNLTGDGGRPFAYQLTLFRNALSPAAAPGLSAWRSNQLYMGHFAVSDIEAQRHRAFEKFGRDGLGFAGVANEPLKVWLDDWQAHFVEGEWRINASVGEGADSVSLNLRLNSTKPLILQGDRGYSQKSAGNASYYYSDTRMRSKGTIQIGEAAFDVTGNSWLDREWSTSSLSQGQAGWDWFSLQLDNGSEIMFYRMRRKDGSTDRHSAGVLVNPAGQVTTLSSGSVKLSPRRHWRGPDGTLYPVEWQLSSTEHELDLQISARIDDAEMRLTFRYWEGAVVTAGTLGRQEVTGLGFIELTGYALARPGK